MNTYNGTSSIRRINEARLANLQKWIAALESGHYCQTTMALHDNFGYCALGVALDTIKEEVGDSGGRWHPHTSYRSVGEGSLRFMRAFEFLFADEGYGRSLDSELESLRTMFGLSTDEESTVINMNDGCSGYRPHTFEEIASWLRLNVVPKLERAIKETY